MLEKKVRRKRKKKQPVDYNALPWLTPLKALGEAAECLKTLAHPHRLRMVQMMLHGRYTVGELATACEIPAAMASDHLRLMQRCGFLTGEKAGRQVFYRIAETHLASLMACVEGRFHPQPAEDSSSAEASRPTPASNRAEPKPVGSKHTSSEQPSGTTQPDATNTAPQSPHPLLPCFVQIFPGNYEL